MAIEEIGAIKRYIGTEAEIAAMSVTEVLPGSTAYAHDTGRTYIFAAGAWVDRGTGNPLRANY